jgi:hypothetical protein
MYYSDVGCINPCRSKLFFTFYATYYIFGYLMIINAHMMASFIYSCYCTCCNGKRNRNTKIRNEVFREVPIKNLAERDTG